MLKRLALLCLSAALCTGVTCSISIDDSGDGSGSGGGADVGGLHTPLDQADATITIRETAGQRQADVRARITSLLGLTLDLTDGQSVSVNSEALTGPTSGFYRRSIPVASAYTVTVEEPSRGVVDSTLASPGNFTISSPAERSTVSLAGFALTWSNPDPTFEVEIELSQTIFDRQNTQDFGPLTDEGAVSFSDQGLRDFRQGADLLITITRTNRLDDVAGFRNGTLRIRSTQTLTVTPGP
jgi:hypothetical protein